MTATEDTSTPAPDPDELMAVVGRLRRSVRRRVREDWPHAPMPEAHLELLRLLEARPGVRVAEAAAALGVAPNTVSTLVNHLTTDGLLERRRDSDDARATRLHLTAAATGRIAAWRDRRQALVAEALASLPPAERKAIDDALPALRRLAGALAGPA